MELSLNQELLLLKHFDQEDDSFFNLNLLFFLGTLEIQYYFVLVSSRWIA